MLLIPECRQQCPSQVPQRCKENNCPPPTASKVGYRTPSSKAGMCISLYSNHKSGSCDLSSLSSSEIPQSKDLFWVRMENPYRAHAKPCAAVLLLPKVPWQGWWVFITLAKHRGNMILATRMESRKTTGTTSLQSRCAPLQALTGAVRTLRRLG